MVTIRLNRLGDVLGWVRDDLRAAGIVDAGAEARRLVVKAAGIAPGTVISEPSLALSGTQIKTVEAWLRRRMAGEPLARIHGEKDFYGRTFRLSPETLEPRADSETLIDVVLELVDQRQGRAHPWRIIDVGTGTGCLLISLLAELPQSCGVGTDLAQGALETAKVNALGLGVSERASWHQGDFLDGIDAQFDIAISNPPYIKREDIPTLQKEVRLSDPVLALDGGEDGITPYRKLAARINAVVPNGFGVFEIAGNDDARVSDVLTDGSNNSNVQILGVWPDLTGMKRCVAFKTL